MSTYNQFRNEFISKIEGIDDSLKEKLLYALDSTADHYEINEKVTALVVQEWQLPRTVVEYLAVRKIDGLAISTLKYYKYVLTKFFETIKKNPGNISTNEIRMYLYNYQQKTGVTNRSLNTIQQIICSFFRWCINEGYFNSDPCKNIKPIKYSAKPRQALTQIELEQIRCQCEDARDKAILEVLYSTGCRVSELVSLKRSDINWSNGEVQLFGKGSKYRTSYLNAKALVALRNYLKSRNDTSEYIFVTERSPHHNMTSKSIQDVIGRISKKLTESTGKKVTPHIIRHTFATQALKSGMPIASLQNCLGHSSPATSMIYAHVDHNSIRNEHDKYVV